MPVSTLRLAGAVAARRGLLGAALTACSSSGGTTGTSARRGRRGPAAARRAAAVTITAAQGCAADTTDASPAGGVTFEITNKDATAVSEVELLSGERIIGEKENIPPGFGGEFAVNVGAGTYTLYCPGRHARAHHPDGHRQGAGGGRRERGGAAQAGQRRLRDLRQHAGRGAGRRGRRSSTPPCTAPTWPPPSAPTCGPARSTRRSSRWPSRSSIGKDNLDADIDARAGDVPAAQWRGFHRIEKALFQQKTLTGMAPYGDKLVADVKRLQKLSAGLTYQPTELANGAQALLDEVAERQDHRRGGAVLAHRPARLREQRRGRRAGVRPAAAGADQDRPGAGEDDRRRASARSTTLVDRYRDDGQPVGLQALHRADQRRQARLRRRGQGGAGAAVQGRQQGRECMTREPDSAPRPVAPPLPRRRAGRRRRRSRPAAPGSASPGRPSRRPSRRPGRRRRRAVLRTAPGRHRHPGAGPAGLRRLRRHRRPTRDRVAGLLGTWAAAAAQLTKGLPVGAVETAPQRAARRHRRGDGARRAPT